MPIFAPFHLFDALAVSIWNDFTRSNVHGKIVFVFLTFELNVCDFIFEKRELLLQAFLAICGKVGLLQSIACKVEETRLIQPLLYLGPQCRA